MGKKRSKGRSSREEDDIDLSGPSCRHIKKGSDQAIVKKLSGNAECHWTNCQDCNPEDREDNSGPSQEAETEDSEPVWMCLKCGHRGCGRHSENKHAIKHYETPRSEPHCLVVNLDNWAVWCYMCDDEVQFSQTGHLAQLLTNLKKLTSTDPSKEPPKKAKEDVLEIEQKLDALKLEEPTKEESKDHVEQPKKKENKKGAKDSPVRSTQSSSEENRGVPVKGLSNLGNTCFFNSVIQNLSQTHVLRDSLNKVSEEKITLKIEPNESSNLEPVSVNLARPGPLTLTMCQLLNEIQETKKNVVAPRELFTQVCKKAARFKGFQQQDSQELLRYLLDGMRAEEIRRTNSGLLDTLKESKKERDEEKLKTLVKEYEKNALPKNVVDQVFGGEMTSTVMCQQCKTVSVVKEMFLDLSLPVSDEAYRKKFQKKASLKSSTTSEEGEGSSVLTNGNDDMPSGSKYQQKKVKKQAKKQAKQQKRQQKFDNRTSLVSLTSTQSSDLGDQNEADKNEEVSNGHEHSDANSETLDPNNENEETEEATSSNRFTLLSDQQSNESTVEQSSDIVVIKDSEEDTEMAESDGQNDEGKAKLDDAFLGDPELVSEESLPCPEEDEENEETAEPQEYTVVNQDPDLAFQTLAQRPSPDKQECSVRSCLHQFTEVETLTQNNSLLCVTCTKRQRGSKAGDSKKNVYTDALKQMLISCPPPVLTLHLKRFQQNGFSLCKVNRHVHFPMVLDLAPFCAAHCKTSDESDSQVLYSLYGIVEHSGTMRSGHYTAYVKVRPKCDQSQSNGFAAQGDTEAPKGSWFHISDTSVQPVPESKVQSCQAYLLFYERTL